MVAGLASGAPCLSLSRSRFGTLRLSVVSLPLRTIITCVTSGFLCLFFMTGSEENPEKIAKAVRDRERERERERERGRDEQKLFW